MAHKIIPKLDLGRLQRPEPQEDSLPTDEDWGILTKGFAKLMERPLIHQYGDKEKVDALMKRRQAVKETLSGFQKDLLTRWNLGQFIPNKDNEVICALAMRKIKELATKSQAMFKKLSELEDALRDSQVLSSPRRIEKLDVTVQQLAIARCLTGQDQVIQRCQMDFFDTGLAYFEALERLVGRNQENPRVLEYLRQKKELFTPRYPKTPRTEKKQD